MQGGPFRVVFAEEESPNSAGQCAG